MSKADFGNGSGGSYDKKPWVRVQGGPPIDPGQSHPGLVEHPSQWGAFTTLATDEVISVEPLRWELPEGTDRPVPDTIFAALGGVTDIHLVGTGMPRLMSAIWPSKSGPGFSGIGTDYSALFPREVFIALRSLRSRYPFERFPNLLLVIDEIFRYQGRERDEAIDPDNYERRNEAAGKLFHELRDPADPHAQEISMVTDCAWPWFAADDTTGDGVNFIMEQALANPGLLDRPVVQPDGREIVYADGVVGGMLWQLRSLVESGRGLILSKRLRQPSGSEWMPPLGSAWRDAPDCYLRLDGTLPTRPAALAEVNAILYRSLRLAARLCAANAPFGLKLGLAIEAALAADGPAQAGDDPFVVATFLDRLADKVRAAFIETFWVDNEAGGFPGYFAELDESGRILVVAPVLTSAVIDSVLSGLFDGVEMKERLMAMMRNIYDPAYGLRATLGPRSLGQFSPHYSPSGWANGSIWPHMNDKAAQAAELHGFHKCAYMDSLLVNHICTTLHAVPEVVVDSDQPAVDQVRVRVRRRQPQSHITSAVEPGKPWQLWSLGAFVDSLRRINDHQQSPRRAPSSDVASLDADLAEGVRLRLLAACGPPPPGLRLV